MPTFHEHPHGIRDVLYAHDPEAAERATEAKAEEIEQALDAAVGRGAITTDDRFDRRNRLRREPELVAEVLASLPGDRDSADQAALRDLRLIKSASRLARLRRRRGGSPRLRRDHRPHRERAPLRQARRGDERAVVRVTAKKNLDAEIERLRSEYELKLPEVAAAEQSHEIEMHRLAGQKALGEISDEDARQGRQTLDADLAAKRAQLALLRDAVPEVERRAAEEVEQPRAPSPASQPVPATG